MATNGKETKVTWYGHATFLFETPGGKRIMIDPLGARQPGPAPDKLKKVDSLDVMLITHGHFDHISDAVQVAKDARPKSVVGIFEIALAARRLK